MAAIIKTPDIISNQKTCKELTNLDEKNSNTRANLKF